MLDPVKNFAKVVVSTTYDAAATSIILAAGDGAKLPAPATDGAFNLVWYNFTDYPDPSDDPNVEIVRVTARTTDTLTVTRAQEGTTASTKSEAGKTYKMILALTLKMIEDIGKYGRANSINIETISATKTLTPGVSPIYQYLTISAAQDVVLATAGATAGDRFVIRNDSGHLVFYGITVKQSSTVLDIVYAGSIKEFIFNGINWISGENGSGENDAKNGGTAVGYKAKSYSYGTSFGSSANGSSNGVAVGNGSTGVDSGVAVGYGALAYAYGVSVGRNGNAATHGVAIGRDSNGYSYSVALGEGAHTNSEQYAVALGYYTKNTRCSEIAHIIGSETDAENNITIGGWEGQTANATPMEILCGAANERFTIRPSSVLSFTLQVTARDNVSGDCAVYHFKGGIKRDGANNTTLLTTTKDIIHEDDATWDVAVTADDTNEALCITVTGDATNIVQWVARLDGVETHF